jgi:hypothetical protein
MFIGPVKCPNCEAFVDTGNHFCPYCSTSLMRAPWKPQWNAITIVGTVLIVGLAVAKKFYGVDFVQEVQAFFDH